MDLQLASLILSAAKPPISELLGSVVKEYASRVTSAQERYEESRSRGERDPIEEARERLLGKIETLRSEAVFFITDSEFQQKTLAMLLAQTLATYEAKSRSKLELVTANVQQIEAAQTSYMEQVERRRTARIAAVAVSVLGVVALGVFLYVAPAMGVGTSSVIAILGLPVPVLLWSVIGSFASILYRFTHSADAEIANPLRWLFSRPLTGIIMGSITYLIIRVGIVTLSPEQGTAGQSLGTKEVMWLIAFLAGFSDRFSDALLKTAIGRLGGDRDDELLRQVSASDITREDGSKSSTGFSRLLESLNDHSRTTSPTGENPSGATAYSSNDQLQGSASTDQGGDRPSAVGGKRPGEDVVQVGKSTSLRRDEK